MRRRAATAVLVLLVVLSGCSFLGGSGSPTATPAPDGTPAPTASPTATPGATATATATPEPTPTASPSPTATPVPYPDGYGPSGAADLETALATHREALLSHESFTITYQARLLTDSGRAGISSLQATNQTTRRAYVATNITGEGTTVQYVEGTDRYTRTNPPGDGDEDVTYESSLTRYTAARYTGNGLVRPVLENLTYHPPEVFETEEGTFLRYRVDSVSNIQSLLGSGVDPANVTSFDAAIVVGPDGAVRRAGYTATVERGGERFSLQVRLDVTNVDEVTLTEPEWVDEARSAS